MTYRKQQNDRSPFSSTIILNMNELNSPVRRKNILKIKYDPTIYCLQQTHFISKYTNILKMKGWKKILYTNKSQKRARIAKLISDKIEFK